MPIYEYYCPKCDSEIELLIRHNEKPVCPNCGNKTLKRHISAPRGRVVGSDTPCPASTGTGHSYGCGCGCGGHHCDHKN